MDIFLISQPSIMAASSQNVGLISDDIYQNSSTRSNDSTQSTHHNTPRFHFQTSSRIQEPIDTSTYCHLHCKKQIYCILSVVMLIASGYIILELGYFFIGILFVAVSVLFMIYGCT